MELLKRVSIFKMLGNPRNWKFEALATMMVITGIILVIIMSIKTLDEIDPNTSFLEVTVHKDELMCVNITCGGLYCLFTQPVGCDASVRFLKLGETDSFCNAYKGCKWDVEVVTDAGYDNRSRAMFVMDDGGAIKYFPQLEQLTRKFIDITKYVDRIEDTVTVEWSLTEDTRSTSMKTCGNTHPELFNDNDRCGAYNIYLASAVYTTGVKKKYELEVGNKMFYTFTSMVTVLFMQLILTWVYGNHLTARKEADQRHTD